MQDLRKSSKWVFSLELDLLSFTLPIVACAALAPFLWRAVDRNDMPLWAYVIAVVLCDVGHVWSTVFRTYLDSEERSRRPALYFLSPPLLFLLSCALHTVSPALFWTLLGYFAIYHFAKQYFGFLCIYKGRCNERWDWTFDKWVVYLGCVLPCGLWHSEPGRRFDWFQRDDPFLVPLPASLWVVFALAYALTALAFLGRQAQLAAQGRLNVGKLLLVTYCWASWTVGVLVPHKVISILFLNLIHGVPSYLIVFFVCRNKWAGQPAFASSDKLVKWFCSPRRWWAYAGVLFLIAVCEEILWETLVWKDYVHLWYEYIPSEVQLSPAMLTLTTSLLTLPQLVHYFLDAFIWKMGDSQNPGLREFIGLGRPKVPVAIS